MRILLLTLILFSMLICPAYAWQGKVIAVNSPTSLVVLKQGKPVVVNLDGVKKIRGSRAEARLKTSSIALMKNAEINETGKTSSGEILADVHVDGTSLANAVSSEDAKKTVQSTPYEAATTNKNNSEYASVGEARTPNGDSDSSNSRFQVARKIDASQLEQRLTSPPKADPIPAPPKVSPKPQTQQAQKQMVRTVSDSQDTSLGLWPARSSRKKVRYIDAGEQRRVERELSSNDKSESLYSAEKLSSAESVRQETARKEYQQAVRSRKTVRQSTGFFKPKKRSEIFVGAGVGPQYTPHEESKVPYSDIGMMGSLSYKHFFPSGIGFGSDFTIAGTSGKKGTIGATSNSTNGTSYDYKSKSFMNYTLTGSLLYRFYSDPDFIPYVGLHGGYTLFSSPETIFHLSNGAPVVGGGAGFLYKFDSDFTLGIDTRYLHAIGTKSDDPTGQLNTLFSVGYTFD